MRSAGLCSRELLNTLREIRECATLGQNNNGNEPYNLFKSMIEVISTSQEPFCAQTEKDILSYVDRSVAISTTGEKEINKFFNTMNTKINSFKQHLA